MPTISLPPYSSENAFTVVTLNLRFGLARDGDNDWSRRRHLFPQFFEALPADFYLMQEANDFQVDQLQPLLADYACLGRRRPAPAFWQHNLVWYRRRWRCTARDHFFLSPTPDLPSRSRASRWPRQCTLGVFENAGQHLAMAATHFDFDDQVQEASAQAIRRRLARLAPAKAVVLAGDFNAQPDSAAHRVFTTADAAPEDRGGAFKNAFEAPLPRHPSRLHRQPGRRSYRLDALPGTDQGASLRGLPAVAGRPFSIGSLSGVGGV